MVQSIPASSKQATANESTAENEEEGVVQGGKIAWQDQADVLKQQSRKA